MNLFFLSANYASSGLIVTLCLLTAADVVGRYFFLSPIIGATEMTCYLLVLIGSFSIMDSVAADEHIRVDFVYEKLGSSGQSVMRRGGALIGVVVFGVLTWQNGVSLYESYYMFYETTERLSWPVWPARFVLFLTFLSSLVVSICQLVTDRPLRWTWSNEAEGEI